MILTICGFKGSGKDTIGDYLIQHHGFKRFHFGSAVKDVCSIIFGWSRHLLEGDSIESRKFRETEDKWWSDKLGFKLTPRIAFQKIGTDVFRNNFHQDIWTLIIEKKIREFQKIHKTSNIVITDCRFKNELQMLRSYGTKVIAVYRNIPEWMIQYKMGKSSIPDNIHVSEYEWIKMDFDFEVNNNSSYEDLYKNIESYVKKIRNKK